MRFKIATKELNYLISKCFNVVSQKPTMPILSNILIEAKEGILTLTATDLIVGMRCTSEIEILEEGAVTINAKNFSQLVRELTAANVEVITEPNFSTQIIADDSKFLLNGVSPLEFPALPDLEGAEQFTVKQAELKETLYRTAFAVSRDENRFILMGVSMQIANGQAMFMGTDGKRLARVYLPVEINKDYSGSFVIPLKAVEEIIKNLGDDNDATVYLMSDKIAVKTSFSTIITKLVAGEYPNLDRVIPNSVEQLVSIHREELMTLLRQVSLFTETERHVVRFLFNDGELHLSANTSKVGEGNVSMPLNYRGGKLEIAFNPTYFLDVLRHSKQETITLGISDSFNPGILTDQSLDSYSSQAINPLYVLMPMRLNEE